MRKLLHSVFMLFLCLSFSCEGPAGPPGPAGEPGTAGTRGPAGEDAQTATVIELPVDFEADEDSLNYVTGLSFQELNLVESDIVLAFAIGDVYDDPNAGEIIFWSPLPQTYSIEEGDLTYNYASANVAIFFYIETDINWPEMEQERRNLFTKQQWFRLVIIPGEFYGENQRTANTLEYLKGLSYKEVMKSLKLSEKDVRRLEL